MSKLNPESQRLDMRISLRHKAKASKMAKARGITISRLFAELLDAAPVTGATYHEEIAELREALRKLKP